MTREPADMKTFTACPWTRFIQIYDRVLWQGRRSFWAMSNTIPRQVARNERIRDEFCNRLGQRFVLLQELLVASVPSKKVTICININLRRGTHHWISLIYCWFSLLYLVWDVLGRRWNTWCAFEWLNSRNVVIIWQTENR